MVYIQAEQKVFARLHAFKLDLEHAALANDFGEPGRCGGIQCGCHLGLDSESHLHFVFALCFHHTGMSLWGVTVTRELLTDRDLRLSELPVQSQ